MTNIGMCEHHNLELIRIHNRRKMLQNLRPFFRVYKSLWQLRTHFRQVAVKFSTCQVHNKTDNCNNLVISLEKSLENTLFNFLSDQLYVNNI
jgi:hypothetical protein